MQSEFVKMFTAEVKEEMINQGLKTYEFAEKCGVTRQYVTRVLTGRTSMGLNVANKLAKGLGMKVVLCLGDVDE